MPNWFQQKRTDIITVPVKRQNIHFVIVERGSLESANNHDIVCRVKGGTRGGTAIKWVIDDGTPVKKGQVVLRLDSSALDDQYKTQQIAMEKAENDYIQARENVEIVSIGAINDRETARVALELAELDRRKFLEGDYEQLYKDIKSRILMAESDLGMWQDRSAYSDRMEKKNFTTPSQAQADRARLKSAELALQKVQEEFRVLENYTKVRTIKDLDSKIAEATRTRTRVQTQTGSQIRQATNDRDTKYSIYLQEKAKLDELQQEIDKCTMVAPEDGLVVYYVNREFSFRSSGSGSGSLIAVGETAKEGQKMMQIPDLENMLVNTRVHEAVVSKVKGEQFENTGYGEAMLAGQLVQPGLFDRLVGYNGYETVRNESKFREREQAQVYEGQYCNVRIDAFPDAPLKGRVRSVATVATQQDFSSDIKVYQTMVKVEMGSYRGLKPGMNSEVTIFTDEHVENVLSLPLQAVFPTATRGKYRCYVMNAKGEPEGRDITIGLSDEKVVEIKDGVNEDEIVVQNPLTVMTEEEKAQAIAAPPVIGGATTGKGKGKPGGKSGAGGAKQGGGGSGKPSDSAPMK